MPNIKITLNDGTTKTVRFDDGFTDEDIEEVANQLNANINPEKKGIDLTPKAIGQTVGNALASPIVAMRDNIPVKQAFEQGQQRLEDLNNANKLGNAIADFTLYAQLPVLKGAQGASALAKAGNFLGNAAIQGGIPGLLEGAKEGNALEGAGAGAGFAAGVQSLPIVGKIAKPILQVAPKTANLLARSLGRIQHETLERAVQPDSKALDLTREQAQNLLMDTTERIQNTYNNLLAKRGQNVGEIAKGLNETGAKVNINDLAGDITETFNKYQGDIVNPARNMTGTLENDLLDLILSGADDAGRISPVDLNKLKQQVGHMTNWSDAIANNYQNPILEQIYGKWGNRLNQLSPELARANTEYAKLRNFQKNEGLKRILKPGDNIDTASSALRNYNNTVTKGNTSRNIQDLEKLFINEGEAPFLNDIDDVNAAMDLLNARSTGDSWLANLTTQLSRPALKGVRYLNQKGIPQAITNFSEKVSPEVRRILTPALVQLGVGE